MEVYAPAAAAEERCQYLGQFDSTLLYSGSYAIIGTMVIRTSRLLLETEQLKLTDAITTVFTTIPTLN